MSKRTSDSLTRHRSVTLPTSNKQSLLPKQFSAPEKIGSGLTAEVYRCQHSNFGEVCVKIINNSFLRTKLGEKLIQNQMNILEKLSHQSIVPFLEVQKHNDRTLIITEYCQGGDMQKIIKSKKRIVQNEALETFSEVIQGCKYLLSKCILHRDIKPANILMKNRGARIVDFGFAVFEDNVELMKMNVGSPLYMAPEVLSSLEFSQKSQVFSLGVMLYQMLSGKTPWIAVSQRDLLLKIKTVKPSTISHISSRTMKMIENCLQVEKNERYTLKQLSNVVGDLIKYSNRNVFKEATNKTNKYDLRTLPKMPNHTYKYANITLDTDRVSQTIKHGQGSIQQQSKLDKINRENNVKRNRKSQCKHKDNEDTLIGELLQKINPRAYSFLPESLILKLEFILQKYKSVIGTEIQQHYRPKPSSQIEKDLMIVSVFRCNNEKELCQTIVGFIRRVLRLTKNYLNYKTCVADLDKFYTRLIHVTGDC